MSVVTSTVFCMDTDLRDLDAAALLAVSSGVVRRRRLAEVEDLQVLAQWAAIHSADPTQGPDAVRARRVGDVLVHLTTGGDYWPFATSTSRRVDLDHPIPYEATGPPGQTGNHNSGPLGRRHHRWKTHAGYRSRQCGQGRYAWLTPHGLAFLVDHTGTRRIKPDHARMIIDAPPGVDLYPV